jgi:predicted ribosomally synthesized peptide with SipW-like signal peptide
MKMTKKKVFVTALAICLVSIISMGTLAWFNASDEVTNKFLIADSDGDGTPDFSVDVWENDPADPTVKDQDGVTYTNIAPGDVIAKNPTVENTGDYDQWIRVYVTFDDWAVIEAACQNQGISSDVRGWLDVDTTAWTADNNATVTENDTVTYVYYYNYKLAKDQTATLFNNVTIPGEFEQEDMRFVSGDFSIKVKAEALQADNTGDNARAAFATYWSY